MSDDITLGELGRRLDLISKQLDRIGQDFVRREIYVMDRDATKNRLEAIEGRMDENEHRSLQEQRESKAMRVTILLSIVGAAAVLIAAVLTAVLAG